MSSWRDKTLAAAKVLARRPAEWSSDQVAIARRMAASGATAEAIGTALGSTLSKDALWARLKKLGIRCQGRRLLKDGFTTSITERGTRVLTSDPLA